MVTAVKTKTALVVTRAGYVEQFLSDSKDSEFPTYRVFL